MAENGMVELLKVTTIGVVLLLLVLVLWICCMHEDPESLEPPLPTSAQQHVVDDARDGYGAADADELPAYQDEGRDRLVLPPRVTQNAGGSNSGRPHRQSSSLQLMYMDSSDGRIVLLPTPECDHWHL